MHAREKESLVGAVTPTLLKTKVSGKEGVEVKAKAKMIKRKLAAAATTTMGQKEKARETEAGRPREEEKVLVRTGSRQLASRRL